MIAYHRTALAQPLVQAAGRPVALAIDEAQHALPSGAGETAMTALKSARDPLNKPGPVNLMLVMSGSDRDKLLCPVVGAAAPSYGLQIQALPPLATDCIAHVANLVEAQRPDLVPMDRAALPSAFAGFGHRPQFFMATDYGGRKPIEQAVLWRLLDQGPRLRPRTARGSAP